MVMSIGYGILCLSWTGGAHPAVKYDQNGGENASPHDTNLSITQTCSVVYKKIALWKPQREEPMRTDAGLEAFSVMTLDDGLLNVV